MTTSVVLHALRANGRGAVWSVELPPKEKNADRTVGILVPDDLKDRWHLRRGSSRRELPRLLRSLGHVDLFIHDSRHSYRNMRREFRTVWPFLREGGVLIADDIDGNDAFRELTSEVSHSFAVAIRQEMKPSLFGFIVKAEDGDAAGGRTRRGVALQVRSRVPPTPGSAA